MRFGTFRTAYRVATRHFGSNVAYRQYYQAPRTVTAMMPYLLTRTNPVTLRLEDQAADGSSNVKQLFSTSMSGSALLSPVSELSSLVSSSHAALPLALVGGFCEETILTNTAWDAPALSLVTWGTTTRVFNIHFSTVNWEHACSEHGGDTRLSSLPKVEYLCRLISWH
ncbi:hypothetical protein TGGT1_270520 [Toxoplasma gondii GT1]|uniref:Uncharacterized protein n=10 Tax=Toxoplasma gondii TaxID=5811 RepID=S7WD74_TOXGG|nr:hypothetical protein TGGT1_270520 [Toxoplasma gondii GT1]KAF4642280.1 hypothetical protein TGRH88_080950 [Toxoplasma gondii]KFG54385.1 hypothetical protein TGFOU_270520 [Toxoplasma gondii FOU]